MRLADFILANIEPILQEWEAFARSLAPGAKMDVVALRDDAEAILRACVRDMTRLKPRRSRPANPKATAAQAAPPAIAWTTLRPFMALGVWVLDSISTKSFPSTVSSCQRSSTLAR